MALLILRVFGIVSVVAMLALSFGDVAHAAIIPLSVNQSIFLSNDDGAGPYTYSQGNSSSLGTTRLSDTVNGTATVTEASSTQTIGPTSIELYTNGYGSANSSGRSNAATGQGSDSLTFDLTTSALVTLNYSVSNGSQPERTTANASVSLTDATDDVFLNQSLSSLNNSSPSSLNGSIQLDLTPGDYVLSSTASASAFGGVPDPYAQCSADVFLTVAAVPEPSSLIIFGLGVPFLAWAVYRRRSKATF